MALIPQADLLVSGPQKMSGDEKNGVQMVTVTNAVDAYTTITTSCNSNGTVVNLVVVKELEIVTVTDGESVRTGGPAERHNTSTMFISTSDVAVLLYAVQFG